MTEARISVSDFSLANPIYIGARVTLWTIDANGAKTTVAATLYAGATGTTTLSNPQTLDGEGKFAAPVYINTPVIATVAGRNVDSYDTGIIGAVFVSGMSLPGGTAAQIPIVSAGLALVCRTISGAFTINAFGVATLTPLAASNLTNGTEGTGAVVLANSPALTTPNIGVATATSINGVTITDGTGTITLANGKVLTISNTMTLAGVNGRTYTFPANDGTVVTLDSTGTLTHKTFDSAGTGNVMQVSGVTISRGQFPGANSNSSATAGNIGEIISSSVASGSAVALVSGAAKTVTSISLTAGDWDVSLNVAMQYAATTNMTSESASISQTNNTLDVTAGAFNFRSVGAGGIVPASADTLTIPPLRISLNATTTIYFVVLANFTVSTTTAWGRIAARRVR